MFSDHKFVFRETDKIVYLFKNALITKYIFKKKGRVYACFVNLRRAFDTVWQNGLLYKLR